MDIRTHEIRNITITPEILKLIAEIDEFKGRWKVMESLAPEKLTTLRRIATIESVGSSTRIEGAKLSDREVEKLLSGVKAKSFASRDEQEVAGYADAMDMVFEVQRVEVALPLIRSIARLVSYYLNGIGASPEKLLFSHCAKKFRAVRTVRKPPFLLPAGKTWCSVSYCVCYFGLHSFPIASADGISINKFRLQFRVRRAISDAPRTNRLRFTSAVDRPFVDKFSELSADLTDSLRRDNAAGIQRVRVIRELW